MKPKFNKYPSVKMPEEFKYFSGWEEIRDRINITLSDIEESKKVVVIECYHGTDQKELQKHLIQPLNPGLLIASIEAMLPPKEIEQMVFPDVTDDRIFGFMTRLSLESYFDQDKVRKVNEQISGSDSELIIIYGIGASVVVRDWDLLLYVDMARWEIQQRMRRQEVNSIGLHNSDIDWMRLYKQGYFVDWRVCDRHKKKLMPYWDFVLDINTPSKPKMIEGKTLLAGLRITSHRPFSLVPFFDPGPWGGQWMKQVCDLDKSESNYAWCFNCVPEENSLLLRFGEEVFETPSINLVFYQPKQLMGEAVYSRFGDEFPIRFDFLDTMGGGNLSLQVHPLTEYIQEKFGVSYTQDESYYLMDAGEEAVVYLGLKDSTIPDEMQENLVAAKKGDAPFEADKFVEKWPVKMHDHLLIPAGTVHCSGAESMVLEISATPYIFTFKLWDWGRLGLDGKPRPINLAHGKEVIQWDRKTEWTKENLINRIEEVAGGDGWREERTGLHESEFIETRRHWFSKPVRHHTHGTVNVFCLVEGKQALVESPSGVFKPFEVNYAETFVVPASVGEYSIRPYGVSEGQKIATLKAYVRSR